MRSKLFTLLFCVFFIKTFAQQTLRPVEQLINTQQPGWPLVKGWIDSAKNKVEVLPCDSLKAKTALYQTQVTTRSPMGAVIFNTGGILVDNGWIRILASGCSRLNRSLPDWNLGKTFEKVGETPAFLLVADDVIGGFFALNGGGLGKDGGNIYYLAPGSLDWEPLEITYTDFLKFCFNNNLNDFYKGQRWKNWKAETDTLNGNSVYNFVPPLWSKQGKNINTSMRAAIPVEEQYSYNMALRSQLGLDKKHPGN